MFLYKRILRPLWILLGYKGSSLEKFIDEHSFNPTGKYFVNRLQKKKKSLDFYLSFGIAFICKNENC